MKKGDWIENLILILPVIFLAIISVWHAFGKIGVQPWSAIYFLSNHLFVIYLASIIYFTVGIIELQKIMKFLVIPYFVLKIIYQILIWVGVYMGSEKLWEHIWSLILVFIIFFAAILLWKSSKETN
jgi:hypothetical protein